MRLRLICLLALLLSLALVSVAQAATITVNSTADATDPTPTDATCDTKSAGAGGGNCTLRAAIQTANQGSPDAANTLSLPAGNYKLTILGQGETASLTGSLDITRSLTINGAGTRTTIVDGNNLDTVFAIVGSGPVVSMSDLTVTGGGPPTSGYPGGISNEGALTLEHVAVSSNSGGGSGGGISSDAGMLTVSNSTISGNSSGNIGGGISSGAAVTVSNSTISGNKALDGDGGGIGTSGRLSLTSSTIASNTAGAPGKQGGGIGLFGGGALATTQASIISNNSAAGAPNNCATSGGTFASNGYNVDSGATCGFTATGDLRYGDPLLGPLQDNGGPTNTHALLAGSPAIDRVTDCTVSTATDQRGVSRPQGPACDSGAYEFVPPPAQPTSPTTAPRAPFAPPANGGSPLPASSHFTLGRATVGRDGTITISVVAPGPGTFSASGTTSSKSISGAGVQSAKKKCKKGNVRKGKKCLATTVAYGSGNATAAAASAVKITIHPSAAAKRALKKGKRLSVALAVTFQPTGGTGITKNSSVNVKLKKKGKRRQ